MSKAEKSAPLKGNFCQNSLPQELLEEELTAIQGMPERDTMEKAAKEDAFRKLLQSQFEVREVVPDRNNGLRAIIAALNPSVDVGSEGTMAIILRGDIVDYVFKHPEKLKGSENHDVLKSYCVEMAKCEQPIGLNEIKMMSEIMARPIHVYKHEDARLVEDYLIYPGPDSIFGDEFGLNESISLYFDSARNRFFTLNRINAI